MSSAPYVQRVARPNGWWGMAVFVATEATLFGTLIGSYFDLRFKAHHWPPLGVPDPKVAVPVILAAVLVATSGPMQLAFVFARRRLRGLTCLALFVALVVQCGFLAMQIHLYLDDLDRFSPSATGYGSIYFTLVGAHHAHVFVGILLNAWLLLRFATGMTIYRVVGLQSVTFYWHFVNVLAMIVTTVQLYPSL
jgi:heme/copper-type cytochrome/quinol oxidase subunit 3